MSNVTGFQRMRRLNAEKEENEQEFPVAESDGENGATEPAQVEPENDSDTNTAEASENAAQEPTEPEINMDDLTRADIKKLLDEKGIAYKERDDLPTLKGLLQDGANE